MTLDTLHLVFAALALAAAAAAFFFWQRGAPDAARFAAERDAFRGELDGLKVAHSELRDRMDVAVHNEATAVARLSASQQMIEAEQRSNQVMHEELGRLRKQHTDITAEVSAMRERVAFADEAVGRMKESFALQSSEALKVALSDLREKEQQDRELREKIGHEKLQAQLKPVSDTLERFEKHVNDLEQKRATDVGGLKAQIDGLMQATTATQAEARKLSTALRRGAGVQGRWGEQTLRNVLEIAGLASNFDFREQVYLAGESISKPDVVVNLPGGGVFVVDAKCSLTAFLDAQDAIDDQAREAALARHAASLKTHVTSLSAKTYWDQFKSERSPDFVAMFVPGDSFLAAALERIPELMTEAMDKRVLLVTPTTLFGLCKAVAYGWRVDEQARNAEEVAKLGKELYKRLSVMGAHVKGVGSALDDAVEKYNKFVGSLESQVLTQAKRFEELKVDHEGKELPELLPVETAVRAVTKLPIAETVPELQLTSSEASTAPAKRK